MSTAGAIVQVTDETLAGLLAAERAVLILTGSDCGYCARYRDEIEALLAAGKLPDIAIGKLVLDQRGASRFKRDNPWLAELTALPFTLLYRNGQRTGGLAASRGSYLLGRVSTPLPA